MPSLFPQAPKSLFESKTLWVNGLTFLVAVLTVASGHTELIPAAYMPYIVAALAAANFALRFLTNVPLAVMQSGE